MSYQTRDERGVIIIEVLGELDVAAATELTQDLMMIFKKFPRKVVLDLTGVHYMASSGLAMLVAALKKSNESRVPFGICGMAPTVRHAVEVTALHEILPIFADLNDALKNLN